ncbi:migration and invasion-inhibitory protein isoform X2 [Symphalangus syndactylus]|uniref:migration and invasion-inhibitory protein isoform X2 n=1 Tax=Symphalangus syndactylus TaxID=9590 RepID=UPI0030041E1B
MVEAEELAQLRLLNLELLRQLWVGQDAVRQSVARAASESSLESSSSYNSETPSTPEMSSTSLSTSCPRGRCSVWGPPDACRGDLRDVARSGAASLPPAKCQHQESQGRPRPHSAPSLGTSSLRDPEPSGRLGDPGTQEAQAPRSILVQQSKLSKPRVTFSEESAVPERSWRLRPYLGYDWIAGSLDTSSSITSQPEAFFSKLQEFRETNKEECICSHPEPQLLGLRESSGSGLEEDHECVYCYRVKRRLFPVPVDPGTPCRLCRTPRDQQGPGTLAQPAQVSTACWAGTFSLRSLRKAQPPGTWTSGPLSPLRPSTRSCQAPVALFTWPRQCRCHPPPRPGQCPRSLGPTSHGRSPED